MSRRGGARAAARLELAVLLLASSAAATAQPRHPPESQIPPLPVKETPVRSPFGQVQAPAPIAQASAASEGPLIRQIEVVADDPGSAAVPSRNWVPPSDGGGEIRLEHRPGQPLDVTWVRSQLARNLGDRGVPPSAAVALVQLINRAFVTAGFVNSGLLVDDGNIDTGVLNLKLIYGRLASSDASVPPVKIEWEGGKARGLSDEYIRARFPSSRSQPLSALALERDFRLLDEDPGIQSISAALRPGVAPGQASLHLLINPASRFGAYLGASNDRSPAVGGDRLFAGGSARGLAAPGDLLSFEGGITRGVEDAQLSYTIPLFSPRLSFTMRGDFNNAAVIARPLELLDIEARDRGVEAGFNYRLSQSPLMPAARGEWSASESLSVGAYFTHRIQKSFLLGQPFSFAPGAVDGRAEFSAIRLGGDYVRRDLTRVIAASLSSTVGLDGTRSDIPSVPNPNRHFVALLMQANYVQRIESGFELRGRLIGQYSAGTLYSAVRLGIGGASTVRGYRESLFLTDRGLIGTVELARALSLSGGKKGFDWGGFTASVFADGATFANARRPQPETKSIASVGAALAWTPTAAFEASVAYGHALKDVAVPNAGTLQDKGLHFRIITYPLRFGL